MRMPLCNGRRHTAFTIGSFTSPLCCRCTSAAVGAFVADSGADCLDQVDGRAVLSVALLMIAVSATDGARSYFAKDGTTNTKRCIFGFGLGLGLMMALLSF